MKLYACRKKNSIDWGFYIKMYIYLCCIDKKKQLFKYRDWIIIMDET